MRKFIQLVEIRDSGLRHQTISGASNPRQTLYVALIKYSSQILKDQLLCCLPYEISQSSYDGCMELVLV